MDLASRVDVTALEYSPNCLCSGRLHPQLSALVAASESAGIAHCVSVEHGRYGTSATLATSWGAAELASWITRSTRGNVAAAATGSAQVALLFEDSVAAALALQPGASDAAPDPALHATVDIAAWEPQARAEAGRRLAAHCADALNVLLCLAAELAEPDRLVLGLLLDRLRSGLAEGSMLISSQELDRQGLDRSAALAPGIRTALLRSFPDCLSDGETIGEAVEAMIVVLRWLLYDLETLFRRPQPAGGELVARALARVLAKDIDLSPALPTGMQLYEGHIAAVYDAFRPRHPAFVRGIEALTQRQLAGASVLELGAGTGRIGEILLPRVASYRGVDLSPAMLRVFAARVALLRFEAGLEVADAMRLPLESESIDAVVEHEALHFVADPLAAIDEALRVLRPDGLLIRILVHAEGRDAVRELHAAFREGAAEAGAHPFFIRGKGTDEHITADLSRRGIFTREITLARWQESTTMEEFEAALVARSHPYLHDLPAKAFAGGMGRVRMRWRELGFADSGKIEVSKRLYCLVSGRRSS